MKTYSAKATDITRAWYVIDASELPLGRIATRAASLLLGKAKPLYTKHVDCGDYVIIINAKDLVVTGNKPDEKFYHHHSGYPGGLRSIPLSDKDPIAVLRHAVRGMLPDNKLRDGRLDRLKIYAAAEHKHDPQQPTKLTFKEDK